MKTHILDAKNKKLGRVASEAAKLLIGKNLPTFQKNVAPSVSVTVTNVSGLDMNDKKRKQTAYRTYTGYPGGLRELSMEQIVTKKGYAEIFKKAVYGMLPTNKLRSKMIKNLIITE